MRVAIAGTNRLAYWIAYYLTLEDQHRFIILSRTVCTNLFVLRCDVDLQ